MGRWGVLLLVAVLGLAALAHAQEAAAGGSAVDEELKNLREWKAHLEGEVKKCKDDSATISSQLTAAQAEAKGAKTQAAQVQTLQKERDLAKADLAKANAALSKANQELAAVRAQFEEAKSRAAGPLLLQLQAYLDKAQALALQAKVAAVTHGNTAVAKVKALLDQHLPGLKAKADEAYAVVAPHIKEVQAQTQAVLGRVDGELKAVLPQVLGKVEALKPYAADPVVIQGLVYIIMGLPAAALMVGMLVCCCRTSPSKAPAAAGNRKSKKNSKVSGQAVRQAAGKPLPPFGRA